MPPIIVDVVVIVINVIIIILVNIIIIMHIMIKLTWLALSKTAEGPPAEFVATTIM